MRQVDVAMKLMNRAVTTFALDGSESEEEMNIIFRFEDQEQIKKIAPNTYLLLQKGKHLFSRAIENEKNRIRK